MTLPSIIPNLVHLARTAARAEGGGLWLLSTTRVEQELELTYYEGLPLEYVEIVRHAPLGKMTCGRAVAGRKPVIAADIHADPEYAIAKGNKINASFSVPVIGHDGRVHGSLACHFTRVHRPSTYDVERNELFARLIAYSLEESSSAAA